MKATYIKYAKTATLALPILFCLAVWGQAHVHQNYGGKSWDIKITGYDPRDLLYGHYLRFRFNWPTAALAEPGPTCLCINPSATGHIDPNIYAGRCADIARSQCHSTAKVYNRYGTLQTQNNHSGEEYYIAEDTAVELEKLLTQGQEDIRISVRVQRDGSIALGQMTINSIPVTTYLNDR